MQLTISKAMFDALGMLDMAGIGQVLARAGESVFYGTDIGTGDMYLDALATLIADAAESQTAAEQ